eukprot:6195257-Pleurochrysis_carterae.AAC.1
MAASRSPSTHATTSPKLAALLYKLLVGSVQPYTRVARPPICNFDRVFECPSSSAVACAFACETGVLKVTISPSDCPRSLAPIAPRSTPGRRRVCFACAPFEIAAYASLTS